MKTEKSIKYGPGQREPIPHPNPKDKAPTINFQSIWVILIYGICYPNRVNFLNLHKDYLTRII